MFYAQRDKICFLRVPKTGSTSMLRMLRNRHGERQSVHSTSQSTRGSHALWFERTESQKEFEGYLILGAVRNPIEWLRSFYVILIENRHLQRGFLTGSLERSETFGEYIRKIKYTPCDWWEGVDPKENLIVYRMEDIHDVANWLSLDVTHHNKTERPKPDPVLEPEDYSYLLERFAREYRYYPDEREKVHLAATGGATDRVCALSDQ